MTVRHFEILVEEPSMEAFLTSLLPRIMPAGTTFSIFSYSGKHDLLRKLPSRLAGYAQWIPNDYGVVVIVDKDDDDPFYLKGTLERSFGQCGILTRAATEEDEFNGLTRIAIEELEAWYFGNWKAARRCYPQLPATTDGKAKYRSPDSIKGGTWEAFERECKKVGIFSSGLRKVEAARAIGAEIEPSENRSPSFQRLIDGLWLMAGHNICSD